jgi:general secretion pathway protein A
MYYEHFGLSGPPFALAGSPPPLFLSAGHREGMAALQWGLSEPSGFTMLVGEIGTGKTTLVHSLLASGRQGIRIAFITTPTLSFEEILRLIASQLGFKSERIGKLELIQALDSFLAAQPLHESVALIFDEAQDLSDDKLEELRLLSNSQWPARKRLQIVLVGQLELARRLEMPELRQLNQRIGARALLPTLRPDEVGEYVEYRLRAHGGDIRKLFKRKALRELAQLSGGIPRRINMLCHNALVLAYAQQAKQVSAVHMAEASRDYDNLLASSALASPTPAPQRARGRGALIKAAAALSLGFAALGLSYFLARGALSTVEPTVYPRINRSLSLQHRRPSEAGPDTLHNPRQVRAKPQGSTTGDNATAGVGAVMQAAVTQESGGLKIAAQSPSVQVEPEKLSPPLTKEVEAAKPAPVTAANGETAPPIPASVPPAAKPTPAIQGTVVVQPGDTLSKIALRHYGKATADVRRQIKALVRANPEIADADHIYPGQIIRLQEASKVNIGGVSK